MTVWGLETILTLPGVGRASTYYAMFPTQFADGVISEYTEPGEVVLDPFPAVERQYSARRTRVDGAWE